MTASATPPCENCLRLQAQLDALQARYEALEATVAQLQRQLAAARKDSSNSSKPPSSDLVKPPKAPPPDGRRRKRGGQPGHPSHQRVPYPPEMLAAPPTDYLLDACPSCGGHLLVTGAPSIVAQRVEIAAAPLVVHEHRSRPGYCPGCRKEFHAPFPIDVERGGLAGPRLTTVVAYLKGACHASYSTIRKFVRDVLGAAPTLLPQAT